MACIGEQFTEGDEICGIVVNVRARQDRLCMWTKTASNEAAQVSTVGSLCGHCCSDCSPLRGIFSAHAQRQQYSWPLQMYMQLQGCLPLMACKSNNLYQMAFDRSNACDAQLPPVKQLQ